MSKIRPFSFFIIFLLSISLSPAWALQPYVIADFSKGVDKKGVPVGWELKERKGKADFSIINEYGIHALHLRSRETSFALQKSLRADIGLYPVLTWRWKVARLPDGGDFRHPSRDDQAAQLYLAFSDRKIIAYIWDSNAPQGLILRSESRASGRR